MRASVQATGLRLSERPACTAVILALLLTSVALAEEPASPRPQSTLRPMLRIEWSRGPDLPQGLQDSDGGVLHGTLISVGGFCSGSADDNRRKPGRYPRGFLKKAWGLDLTRADATWTSLPDFPGAERQGLSAAIVQNSLHVWGGFSYTAPFTYADGWRLDRKDDQWRWSPLPPLPSRRASAALCAAGSKIYCLGGADYDGVVGFFTDTNREGKEPRLGSRFHVLDTADLAGGWKPLPECPGTPRFVCTLQAVGERLYAIGGATGADRLSRLKSSGYCTVVDNWRFDVQAGTWSRLRDLPVSSGNFPKSVNLVFQNRYILLPGGHQYAQVANPDGTARDKYGTASQKRPESGLHNDVFVYDTQTDLFGTADRLPIDNNLPMSVLEGDRLYLLGGETGGGEIDGEFYGHHPDLLLVGKIGPIAEP